MGGQSTSAVGDVLQVTACIRDLGDGKLSHPFFALSTMETCSPLGVSMLMEHHARLRMQGLPSIKANWPAPIGVWRVGAGRRLPFTTRCRVFLSTIKSCTQDSPLCLTFLGRSSRVFDGAIRPAYQHCVKTDCVILRLHPSDCPPYYCPSTVGDSSVPVVVYQSEHRVDTERIPYISCSPRVGR